MEYECSELLKPKINTSKKKKDKMFRDQQIFNIKYGKIKGNMTNRPAIALVLFPVVKH